MKFSIITPTYKRADKLTRATKSVLHQTYKNWKMIIVNDSPDDADYTSFEKNISDPRVIYLKNKHNVGVNFSRNRAIDSVPKDSDWVIFLDDDDYLMPDALATFRALIQVHLTKKWFVTNRAYARSNPVTDFPTSGIEYSYAWDYLITKRCKGDATHCIATALIKDIRFSERVKQAEEWLFFYQIGLKEGMFYYNHDSTLTDGYSKISGLNFRKRAQDEQFKTFFALIREGHNLRLLCRPTFLIYLFMRFIRILVKS